MAATSIRNAKANVLAMDRGNHLSFSNERVYAPIACPKNKDLAEVLDAVGADEITVYFRTVSDPKEVVRDMRTYSRRLETLTNWTRTEWANQVIRGHVMDNIYEATLTRKV